MNRVVGLLTGDGVEGADRKLPAGGVIVGWPGTEEKLDVRRHMPLGPGKLTHTQGRRILIGEYGEQVVVVPGGQLSFGLD